MSDDERQVTSRLSDDGTHLVIVERWLDRQWEPPRWRSKNRTQKLPNLSAGDIEYHRQRADLVNEEAV